MEIDKTKIRWNIDQDELFGSKEIKSQEDWERVEKEAEKREGIITFHINVWNCIPTLIAMEHKKYSSETIATFDAPSELLVEAVEEAGGYINRSGIYPINQKVRKWIEKNVLSDPPDEFYTMEEFAELFKISLPTVKRWIKAGKIRAIKVGRTVRIPKEEISRLKGKLKD